MRYPRRGRVEFRSPVPMAGRRRPVAIPPDGVGVTQWLEMEPEIRYATTADGVSIAYYSMGEGIPLVVTSMILFSHLHSQFFREFHRSRSGKGLGRGLQLVRYDERGTGLSDRHPIDFSIEARLLDLDCVIDRLALTRFALMGMTHGGTAAIGYAARNPERVTHLILSNPYARDPPGYLQGGVLTAYELLERRPSEQEWERYTLTIANALTGFGDSELARKLATHWRESMTLEAMLASYAAQRAIDLTPLLPKVAVPTLVMHRASPAGVNAVPMEASREVASKIPDARFVTLSSGDNWTLWTDEETRIVEDFLCVEQEAPAPGTAAAISSHGATARVPRTILFTDIESNTDILQRLGDDAWRAVLRDHERVTREVLRAHGGAEVKTMGDGFMVSFDSATNAVQFAVDLQKAYAARNESAAEPIRVRMGVNAGEPIAEDDDLFGTAVTVASRIMSQAQGGEILVSDVVRGLVAGKGFVFADHGEFTPKGFEAAVHLYEVRWRD